jgi:hypothetical protein
VKRRTPMVFVCLRETTPLPELVYALPKMPLATSASRLVELGFASRCRPMMFEGPGQVARAKLVRHTCDQHGRPVMLVPPGTFSAEGPRAS